MKFSVNSKELQVKLAAVSKVVQKKNILQILNSVKVSQQGTDFILTGANMEAQLSTVVDMSKVGSDKFVPFCIDLRRFQSILGTLPEQPIEIEVDDQNNFATVVRYAGGDFKLTSQPAEAFPSVDRIAHVENPIEFKIASNILLPSIRAAQTCTGNEEFFTYTLSIALDVNTEGVNIVATDSKKLYLYRYNHGVPFLICGEGGIIMVPRLLASAIESSVGKSEDVTIRATPVRVEFETEKSILSSVTVEGKYAPYDRVIPKNQPYHAVVNVAELTMAVRRAMVMTDSASDIIVIEKSAGALTLHSRDSKLFAEANTQVLCEDCTLPDDYRIGIPASSLLILLGNVATDNVRLCLSDPSCPIILKEDDSNSALTELIMPMNIGGQKV